MKWWDFTDLNFILFFSILAFLLLVLIVVIFVLVVSNIKLKKKEMVIQSERDNLRIYVINVKRNIVTYFSRSNIQEKRMMDLQEFYDRFHPNDREKIKQWIFNICSHNDVEPYLEADAVIEKEKNPYFSLLKLVKYNHLDGLIHIENHILRYITPINNVSRRKKGMVVGVVKRSVMEQIIAKERSIYGFTFAIRFFYIKQKVLTNDKVERFMSMTLKNEIYPFVSQSKNPRQIVDISSNEMILVDLRISNKDDAMHFASSISHSLNKAIALNGFVGSIGYSIGVVENALFYQDFPEMLKHAQEACIEAQQNEQNVLLYQKTTSPELKIAYSRDTIIELMKSRNLRYLFRPIIDSKTQSILGYFEYVRAYNSPYSSYLELSKYAEKSGENRNLLSHVCHNIIPKFNSEKQDPNHRLFFLLSLIDVTNIVEIIKEIPDSENAKIVLMLDEQEVNENSSDLSVLNQSFSSLHANGYELALLLEDKNLLLDPSVYYNFDYFIAGANMMGEIKMNNRIRLSIHTLIEQLLKFKKPIIATDVSTWSAIELIIKSGISYVSSEVVASSNDMFLPIDKKKMEKLGQMGDKYI